MRMTAFRIEVIDHFLLLSFLNDLLAIIEGEKGGLSFRIAYSLVAAGKYRPSLRTMGKSIVVFVEWTGWRFRRFDRCIMHLGHGRSILAVPS